MKAKVLKPQHARLKSPGMSHRMYSPSHIELNEEVEVIGRSEENPDKMVIRNKAGDLFEIIEEALELLKEVPEVVGFFKKVARFFSKLFNIKPKA